jgi:hypothetical protein
MTDTLAAERSRKKNRRWPLVVVVLISAGWLFLKIPTPVEFLTDPDGGHQISGAQQIEFGEHPFADWRSTYGPAVFYASYVFRWLFGQRLVSDVILSIVGFAAAYALLFVNIKNLTGRAYLGFGVLTVALLQTPRFYKYYILLFPLLVLFLLFRYLDHRCAKRAILIGAAVAIAGLFRPDYGVYTLLASAITIIFADRRITRATLSRLSIFVISVGITVLPWLLFMIYRGTFIDYLLDSSFGAASHAKGLALPLPIPSLSLPLRSIHNMRAFSFFLWYLMPLATLLLLFARRKALDPVYLTKAFAATLFAALCLLQSTHRSDFNHLIQAISCCYVLMGFLLNEAIVLNRETRFVRWPTVLILAYCMAISLVSVSASRFTTHSVSRSSYSYFTRFYRHRAPEFIRLTRIAYPNHAYLALLDAIQLHSGPGQRILAIPFETSLYFLSERPFAGGQMLMAPGYFSSDQDQRQLIETLKTQGNPLIIEAEDGGYDNRPERMTQNYAPIFYDYLSTQYRPIEDHTIPAGYTFWTTNSLSTGALK